MAYTSRAIIASAVSGAAHHDEAPSRYGPTCYADFCHAAWHRLQPATPFDIMVKFCPILTIPLGDLAFVLPAASAASTAATSSGRPLGFASTVHTAADSDEEEDQAISGRQSQQSVARSHGIAVLAHSLASIAAALGVRPEAFCLGPAAVAVGKSLSFVASSDAPPAAFVLVDRGVDLTTPLLHSDMLMQKGWDRLRCAAGGAAGDGRSSNDENHGNIGNSTTSTNSTICTWEDEDEMGLRNQWEFDPPAHVPVPMPSIIQTSIRDPTISVSSTNESVLPNFLPGSLFHPSDPHTTSQLGFLLTRPGKDGAMFVRKWLREAARKEGIPAAALRSKPGAIGAAELRALASAISASPAAAQRNSSLLQLAEAASLALEEAPAASWDALSREEKLIIMACAEGPESACEQLVDVLGSTAKGGLIQLPQAVGLLLIAYQILPEHLPWYASGGHGRQNIAPFSGEHESRLCRALADAILACSTRWSGAAEPESAAKSDAPWLPGPLLERLAAGAGAVEDAGERRAVLLEIKDAVQEVLARLRELSQLRQAAKGRVSRGSTTAGGGLGEEEDSSYSDFRPVEGTSSSVLVRLAGAIADRAEVPGLKHANTSIAGLLKSSLGRFGLQKQPRPGEYPLVVLFVIGGVSIAEIHEVLACVDAKAVAVGAAAAAAAQQQVESSGFGSGLGEPGLGMKMPPPKVIVGGTALLQPREVVARALCHS